MGLKDLHYTLDKEIYLDDPNSIKEINTINKLAPKNLDQIKWKKKKLNLKSNTKLKPTKKKTSNFDPICKKWKLLPDVNLQKKIINYKKLFSKLKLDKVADFFKLLAIKLRIKNKFAFYFILLIAMLLVDALVLAYSLNQWVKNIKNLENFSLIEETNSKIKTNFFIAKLTFTPFSIIPSKHIENLDIAISIWEKIPSSIENWLNIYKLSKQSPDEISKIFKENKHKISSLKDDIVYINKNLNNLNSEVLNDQYISKIENIKKYSLKLESYLSSITNNYNSFLSLIWNNKTKKYLIVFQNNHEIRPSWGFMWSAAILSILNWKIINFEKKDIYSLAWDVNKIYNEKAKAPSWLDKFSPNLNFHDSNAYMDFWESSKAMNYMLKKWWYNMDWILFINQNTILSILEKINWVYFSEYNVELNHTNFSEIMSILVESKVSKYGTLWTPKQALFSFIEDFKSKIIKEKKYKEIIDVLLKDIESREIVFYPLKREENSLVRSMWLSWEYDFDNYLDFNYPVYISYWGNKSDKYINRSYKKTIQKNSCQINTSFELSLVNTFSESDESRIKENFLKFWLNYNIDLLNILWKGKNKNYVILYLPKNANIIWKDDLIIKHEDKFTIIEFEAETFPWETFTKSINYNLENKDCKKYNYKLYKQSWIKSYNIEFLNNPKQIKNFDFKKDFVYQ